MYQGPERHQLMDNYTAIDTSESKPLALVTTEMLAHKQTIRLENRKKWASRSDLFLRK